MKKGFTLVELMVTIGVMAVLTAGVVSLIGPGSKRYARDAQRQTDLQTLVTALTMYRNDKGLYPGCPSAAVSCNVTTLSDELVDFHYLQAIPADPSGGTRIYRYAPSKLDGATCNNTTSRCAKFTVCAGSEKNPTIDNAGVGKCGGAGVVCGAATELCFFVEGNK